MMRPIPQNIKYQKFRIREEWSIAEPFVNEWNVKSILSDSLRLYHALLSRDFFSQRFSFLSRSFLRPDK